MKKLICLFLCVAILFSFSGCALMGLAMFEDSSSATSVTEGIDAGITSAPSPTSSPTTTVKPTVMATTAPTATVIPTATATPKPTATTKPAATATPKPTATTKPTATPISKIYILNTNTNVFHVPTCHHVSKIAPENYQKTTNAVTEILANGFLACGTCKPN